MNPLEYETPTERPPGQLSAARTIIVALCYAVAAVPSGMLLGVYSSFALASIYLGRAPSYGNPDPATLPQWVMSPSVLMLPGMVLVPGVVGFFSSRVRHRLPCVDWAAPAILAVLAWASLIFDPFDALSWWAD